MRKQKVLKLIRPRPAINPDCVAFLQDALKRAKKGHIQTVFLVGQTLDGGIISGWSKGEARVFSMLGGIEEAKMRYAQKEVEQ